MALGFLLLGSLVLEEVLAGGGLFLGGASFVGVSVVQLREHPRASLLAKAALGAGVAGLALSVLMLVVSPFTGESSQSLGAITGGIGLVAGSVLVLAAFLAERGARPSSRSPE